MSISNEFYAGEPDKIVLALKSRDEAQLADSTIFLSKANMGTFFFDEADALIVSLKEHTAFKMGRFESAWNFQLIGDPKTSSVWAVSMKDPFVQTMAKLSRAQLHDVAYTWRKSVKDEHLFGRQAFNVGWAVTGGLACLLVAWGLGKVFHPAVGIVWSVLGLFFIFKYYGPGVVTTDYVLGSVQDFEKLLKGLQRVCLVALDKKCEVIFYCSS